MGLLKENQHISSYIIRSQEEEIKRIALELHEGVGQNLYSLYTGLQFIETGTDNPQMKSYIQEMERLMERTLQEIRLLTVELHPPALSLGLFPAMKSYAKLYTSTFGIIVELENYGVEKSLPEQGSIAMFRVCQEVLVNAAKHADATKVKISFLWNEASITIKIRDFGKGFNCSDTCHGNASGLAAIKERMHQAGGDCTISSKIWEGTTVEISHPFSKD